MNTNPSAKTTPAFYLQAILSFVIALAVVVIGELYLPVAPWARAFLAIGTVFLVSSTFTLAKCVRDHQDTESVVGRLDAARVERLLAEFDPYRVPGEPAPTEQQPRYAPAPMPAPVS
ncbi:YiaA/YiaB family inner membrane protein [uncultured Jatrophihabitans sp.]|uniref:YiaA/YiaB family inner membrane protein n=1 Tax=uncultured Jatrophihabitans sp. TaxID=1610747 RepID=UPI0035CBBC88